MRTTVAILIIAGALSLPAADLHFGVQGALSVPVNDLSSNAYVGLQAGAHARWYFEQGHGLMVRGDMTLYAQNGDTSVTDLAVAADYTYHLERRLDGLYVLAGLSQDSYHTSYSYSSRNDTGLGVDLGAGYDLDHHLGVQARYVTHSYSGLTYSALNLGVTYTF
ncbi:MAG: outer membrane beta-barrel protein [Holophaga sp.]